MPSWWDSLEIVSKFNVALQWIAATLAILAGLFGALILVSGSRLSELQNKRDEAKEAEFKGRLEAAEEKGKDRHLTAVQRARLIEILRTGQKGKVWVNSLSDHSESKQFAEELASAIKEGGWELVAVGSSVGVAGKGLRIAASAPDTPGAGILQHALGAIGLPPEGTQSNTDDVVVLFVLEKP